ncbi:MAG: alpha/beta fold hydrolase [Leptospiraceae bacterium]|nr:alpha/beta fold hydrolase [Leptospiraceae bacterium]
MENIRPVHIVLSALGLVITSFVIGGVALALAFGLLALILIYPLFSAIWNKLYGAEDIADALFFARTEDGWNIPLHFHRPDYPKPGAYPVIFCHGIAVNKFGVDMDRRHSLAFYLKQRGYPVFVMGMRGTGKAHRPGSQKSPRFTFDDIVEYDVPAAIRRVRELTGAPKVTWIGHSMGAMVASGFLGRKLPESENVACLVSIGSPGRLDHVNGRFWSTLSKYPWLQGALDLKLGANVIAPVSGRVTTPVERFIYSPENVSSQTVRKLLNNAIENINPGVASQMLEWIQKGTETTEDGSYSYRNGFSNIKVPTLYIAGEGDLVAPPRTVIHSYRLNSSRHKDIIILSREDYSSDYCHIGLVLGEEAPEEIFPEVHEWLNRYGNKRRKGRVAGTIKKVREFLRSSPKQKQAALHLRRSEREKKRKQKRKKIYRDQDSQESVIQS